MGALLDADADAHYPVDFKPRTAGSDGDVSLSTLGVPPCADCRARGFVPVAKRVDDNVLGALRPESDDSPVVPGDVVRKDDKL